MREIVIQNINGKEEIVYKDEKQLQVINPNRSEIKNINENIISQNVEYDKEIHVVYPTKSKLEMRKEINQKLNEEFYRSNNKKKVLENVNKKTNYKKIVVYGTIVSIAITGALVTAKLQKDYSVKRATILRENKTFASIEIKKGDTIESITREYYNRLPEDKKQYITFESLKSEIIATNGLYNPDKIIAGNHIIVPYYLEEEVILRK